MGCWNSKNKPESHIDTSKSMSVTKVIKINIPLDTKKPVGVPLVTLLGVPLEYNYIINRQELFFKEYIKQLYPYGIYNYPCGRC